MISTTEQRRRDAVERVVAAAVDGCRLRYNAYRHTLDWPDAWPEVFRELVAIGRPLPATIQRAFAEQWVGGRADGGRELRASFGDDMALLVDGLRLLLVPMHAAPPLALYRGQSLAEYERGIFGLSWSDNPMEAEFYARHRVMNEGATVVLVSFSPADAIISQPDTHEFIVDPSKLRTPSVLLRPTSKFRPIPAGGSFVDQCETLALYRLTTAAN